VPLRIVPESLNTNTWLDELCPEYDATPVMFHAWKGRFVQGGRLALSGALKDPRRSGARSTD
jgi:hypothetical protein